MEHMLTASTVLQQLKKLYNPPKTFLNYRTPLDLLVVTILSAQCTDARVNIVSKELFKKYNTPEDYITASQEELEHDIKTCGFFHAKAKYIKEMSRILIEEHNGHVPDSMEELTKLPGVGRKTAAIILRVIFDKNEGIAVDTHVMRLAKRLGLSHQKAQGKIELDLMRQVPQQEWGNVTTYLISHGRAVCTAFNRACDRCVFQKECPSSKVMGRKDCAENSSQKRTLGL
jgi:endonuclease-3